MHKEGWFSAALLWRCEPGSGSKELERNSVPKEAGVFQEEELLAVATGPLTRQGVQ